jgi:hypothetical protein
MDTEDLTTCLIQIANFQYFLAHFPGGFFLFCGYLKSRWLIYAVFSHLRNSEDLSEYMWVRDRVRVSYLPPSMVWELKTTD